MGQPKHTPGPWLVGVNVAQQESPIGEEFLGVGVESGRTICRVTRLFTEDEEDGYNASLIAAAPDLLAAAVVHEQFLAHLNTCASCLRYSLSNRNACEVGHGLALKADALRKAAIAKAETE